ncbi:hypothetical protein FF011L_04070 [Roseimaritima multifibrata]|uniref:Uncharacterized protein n=1 Tax=Roseimaritima multifibrata TaxID=1930274 RepID=A0A517M9V8_9BACT|nr:hypothetical protein [Roseimaritima multifibrata]QDS91675.1 hypothetical protein FF011L_04070 [Roseimaritima multifibrata]
MAKKKAAAKKAVTLTSVYDDVARKADTAGLHINVAETKRVLATFFDVLEDLSTADAADIVAKGLKQAKGRRR